MKYNFSKLWSAQFWGFYQFKSFFEFASDKESQISYCKRLDAIHVDEKGTYKIETPQRLIDYMTGEIESALELVKNQFIVFLFTRYETIIQYTVKCLLCDNPERILKLTRVYPDYKETVRLSLKEFIESESKEEYVETMSERLSLKMVNGKPSNVVNRLKCLLSFEDIDTVVLDELMDRRNNIVHEGKIYAMELSELETYYDAIDNLLKVLALALKKIDIAVIDDAQIL